MLSHKFRTNIKNAKVHLPIRKGAFMLLPSFANHNSLFFKYYKEKICIILYNVYSSSDIEDNLKAFANVYYK